MASRIDTLKLACVDLEETVGVLGRADHSIRGQGTAFGVGRPEDHVQQAVAALIKTTRRLQQSFKLEDAHV